MASTLDITDLTTEVEPADRRAVTDGLWFLRSNPLLRERLADPALRELLEALVDAEQALAVATTAAEDALYERIGAATDPDERRALVALRRAVHNDRPAPADVHDDAVAWATARTTRDAALDAVTSAIDDAARGERVVLARQVGHPDLRRSLDLVAPQVAAQAERYRDVLDRGDQPASRHRKSERGLLQYLTRAAVRTSPLSRFTAVSLAVPATAADGAVDPALVTPDGASAHASLDRVMLAYLVGGLDPRAAWCGLPPTAVVEGDRLFWLGAGPAGTTRMAVAATGLLGVLVDAVRLGPRRLDAVRDVLAKATGDPDLARTFLDEALRRGMLCRYADPEDRWDDVDRLLAGAVDADPGVADVVAAVRTALADLETREPGRRDVLERVEQALVELSARSGRPARVPAHEDYYVPPAHVNPDAWAGALADLGPAAGLLSVFDWLHDVRSVMPGLFARRYGADADVPLVEQAPTLVGDVTAAAEALAAAGSDPDAVGRALDGLGGVGGVDAATRATVVALTTLRRDVTATVHAGLDAVVAAGGDELRLEPDDVRALLARLPDPLRQAPLSYGALVQRAGDRLVLNDGLPGHGMLLSRFLGADAAVGGRAVHLLRARLEHVYGGPHRLVEDRSLHGLNVNAHPRVLEHGLDPEDWHRLRLRTEAGRLAVVDPDDGAEVRVLPLGGGHPGLYPPALSVASGLTMTGRLYNSLPDQWHAAHPELHDQTLALPRISVGDVVVARRRWYPGPDLDDAVRAPDDATRLVELTRWRARHGVPAEVVLKTIPRDTGPDSAVTAESQDFRLRNKPQYLDLASAVAVHALPRMLERRAHDTVSYLEEAAPAVGESPHATEWVVEVVQRPGDEFRYGPVQHDPPRTDPATTENEGALT
ncbi:hypothetical protein GCM10023340_33030 [Nocardioides marinquilinus]|uniref:Lantibiotic dehydratase N-terminal domain-containing protein n=1 Tax=Nocardioides marinquilinus TaxID=1210400 RepID=A0ABP9PUT6_9ACTN